MYKLFDFQKEIRKKMDEFFKLGGQRLLIQAPTGTGKSVVMCDWIDSLNRQDKPVYFVTHSKNLLRQFSEHLDDIQIRHGVIAPGFPVTRDRIQVISAQSLMNKISSIAEPYALLFEEAHHSTNNTFRKILDEWKSCKLVGMTATPQRTDGASLKDVYEDMIVSPSVRWFIDNGYLSDYSYFVPHELDTSGIHRVMGDFHKKELAERLKGSSWRVGSLVENYQRYAEDKTGIVFGTSIEDSESISEKFRAAGYDIKALHSKMSDDLYDVLRDCKNGKQKLVSCCDIIGEGTDIAGLETMLDARPTQSLVIQMQHWGRVLRAKYASGHDLSTKEGRLEAIYDGGKTKAVILDFSSNYIRHGLPDDERSWSLDKGRTENGEGRKKLKVCPRCHRPVPESSLDCPHCSYHIEVVSRQRRPVQEIEGNLITVGDVKRQNPEAVAVRRKKSNRRNIDRNLRIGISVVKKFLKAFI